MRVRIVFQDITDDSKATIAPLLAFVEVNDADTGKSVKVGEWVADGDYECLDLVLAEPPVKLTGYRGSQEFNAYKRLWTDNTIEGHLHAARMAITASSTGWLLGSYASVADAAVAQAQWHAEQAAALLAVHMGD